MTNSARTRGWVDRLPTWARLLALLTAGILLMFLAGLIVGVGARSLEEGEISGRGAFLALAALLASSVLGWLVWRLSVHWRRPGRSEFERRYTRTWVIIIGLGVALGLALGGLDGPGDGFSSLFSTRPIAPGKALLIAALTGALLIASLALYHRAIDDHEQQAYLWANSIAFYFLVIAIPVAWLLARGGLIPSVGIGTALLILLGAILINCLVWLKLKYL